MLPHIPRRIPHSGHDVSPSNLYNDLMFTNQTAAKGVSPMKRHLLSTVLLPGHGWPYDPFVTFVILAGTVAAVTVLCGPRTLADSEVQNTQ